jgi:hypothetical protein
MIAVITQRHFPHSKGLSWLLIGLVALITALSHPAKADDFRYRRDLERQHAIPYRHHGHGYHHGPSHYRHHEPFCTTRAVPYWDGIWGQWRTRYVRECW